MNASVCSIHKQRSAHTISLTATLVLAARQILTYKHLSFSSPTLRSCYTCWICSVVCLIPMESASDLSLQRQGTALALHRCAHHGGSKGVWVDRNWQVRMVGEQEHGALQVFCSPWHLAHSHQSHRGPTLCHPPSTEGHCPVPRCQHTQEEAL